MNDYEGIFIINPELKEEEIKSVFKSIGDSVTKNGGSIKKEEPWGKKPLTFRLKKCTEGQYYKLDFTAPPEAIEKMEGAYKLNPDILRTMITRR